MGALPHEFVLLAAVIEKDIDAGGLLHLDGMDRDPFLPEAVHDIPPGKSPKEAQCGGVHPEVPQHTGKVDSLSVVAVKTILGAIHHLRMDPLGSDIHIHSRVHSQCVDNLNPLLYLGSPFKLSKGAAARKENPRAGS